jgi:hypothetical protein
MSNAATAKTKTETPATTEDGLPPGHPARQFIHQVQPKKFDPNPTHAKMFRALAGAKDAELQNSGAALMIAFMSEELGEKALAEMSEAKIVEWVSAFRRKNPRLWTHFRVGHVPMLERELHFDPEYRASHEPKPIVEWQRIMSEILRSQPELDS